MATKISYTQQGDYLLPDLKLPEQPKVEIGIWGKQHLKYIEHHRPILYTNLLTRCKLTAYLADIDEQAEDMFFRLVNQLVKEEGVNEQLKAENQMQWVRKMNNIKNQAITREQHEDDIRSIIREEMRACFAEANFAPHPMANASALTAEQQEEAEQDILDDLKLFD